MGTFQQDLDSDRDDVFLDTTGYGFAVDSTYTTNSTGATSTVQLVPEELTYSIFDAKQVGNFHVSEADVASPVAGDRFTAGGATWTVINVKTAEGMHVLSAMRLVQEQ